jgi:hypothetical protein
LAKFITDQAKADTEPNAFTRDLLQHLIDEAQQRGGLSALSLAFVLRLLVARADLSCEALASVIVPALPLSFNANGTRKPATLWSCVSCVSCLLFRLTLVVIARR